MSAFVRALLTLWAIVIVAESASTDYANQCYVAAGIALWVAEAVRR